MLVGVSPQGGRWVKLSKAGQGCILLGSGASCRLAGDSLTEGLHRQRVRIQIPQG